MVNVMKLNLSGLTLSNDAREVIGEGPSVPHRVSEGYIQGVAIRTEFIAVDQERTSVACCETRNMESRVDILYISS